MSVLVVTTPVLGAGPDLRPTTASLKPGTVVHISRGKLGLYIQASGAIGTGALVTIDAATLAFYGSSSASGSWTCPTVAFASGEFGFVFKNLYG